MGKKLSKQPSQSTRSQQTNSYSSSARAYAKWESQKDLVSNDIQRFTLEELQNLEKHKKLTKNAVYRTSSQQTKMVTNYNTNEKSHQNYLNKTKQHDIKKSRSFDHLAHTTTVITAQQLLYDQAKRKRKMKSASSHSSIESLPSSASRLTSSQNRKNIPLNFQLVLINQNEFQNVCEIGKGHFGTVYRASYKGNRDVALKSLHPSDESSPSGSITNYDANMFELLREAHVMTRLKHPNLLRIIGVTFFGTKQNLSLVTDFMKNGSLLNYLRNNYETYLKSNHHQITKKLNNYAKQIFDAMLYLEEKQVIHRDLAARNCLIGEEDKLKVGDFGLTTLTECGTYKGTYQSVCAPRWTAPEAMFHSKFSTRSDVWSYGITLWEIYTLGERPFGQMTNFNVQVILKNSSENLSQYLYKPKRFGSDETYTHIILPCLTYQDTIRPRFRDLKERITTILVKRN